MNFPNPKTWAASTIVRKVGCDLATARKIKAGELTVAQVKEALAAGDAFMDGVNSKINVEDDNKGV